MQGIYKKYFLKLNGGGIEFRSTNVERNFNFKRCFTSTYNVNFISSQKKPMISKSEMLNQLFFELVSLILVLEIIMEIFLVTFKFTFHYLIIERIDIYFLHLHFHTHIENQTFYMIDKN